MFWHNLKLSFRVFAKDKLNSIINISGLAIGIAAVLLLSIYVQHELSYDQFHTKKDRIVRLITLCEDAGKPLVPIVNCLRLTKDNFADKVPEIEQITQSLGPGNQSFYIDKNEFQLHSMSIDSNFHKVFSIQILHSASHDKLFRDHQSVAISRSTALKLFQSENVIGKSIIKSGQVLSISSVVEDIPTTSHFNFEILLPIQLDENDQYQGLEYDTYILLQENCNQELAKQKINEIHTKILDVGFGWSGEEVGSLTQNLLDIHLNKTKIKEIGGKSSMERIYIHLLLATLILIIAVINFTNILIVQSESKIHQVGIQKAVGATHVHLIKSFLVKTVSLTSISLVLGVIITEISLPHFSNLMNRELSSNFLSNPLFLIILLTCLLLISFITALYPSIMLSRFKAASIMKGNYNGKGKNSLSKGLVIFQFAVAICLVTSVIISQQQIHYMKNIDLGFNPSQVISISNLSQSQRKQYHAIKDLLLQNPNIISVSASDHYTGMEGYFSGEILKLVGSENAKYKSIDEYKVMPDYFETMGFEFVYGNAFPKQNFDSLRNIIINEKAIELLEIKGDPIQQKVWFGEEQYSIIGVVKDFHNNSLRKKITPMMFSKAFMRNFILVKINEENQQRTIEEIKKVLAQVDPIRTNRISFAEDICRNQYRDEENSLQLSYYSSILSIMLALLGLYSLSLFMTNKRTKEIGIRKVNGASVLQIIYLLFSNYFKWITIAFVLATPISYVVMQKWLSTFAYHISIEILPFIIAGLACLLFALFTVGFQALKASRQNPVESLRYE
ncbi:hypothetical protein DF185_10480 [Marinifilum breve]|uniref:ABC3 transporter permease protein domain-containing protein n=1 Tax=Marinifilum breve TaxID=2184082 RepID=A0A2V4A179_9BACT|nr:ABC transporter permease [Marinifilum breve]PXY01070.1 hypothetical protein DF185_10480 [Marinifilum breve]